MKLFNKYNRLNLLATVSTFIIAGFAFYFFIHSVLINQLDDDLGIEKSEIELYVSKYDKLPQIMPVRHQVVIYTPVSESFTEIRYRTFEAADSSENDMDNFRGLDFGVNAGGHNYKVSVMKPLESTENLLWLILLITLSTILILLSTFYVINRIVLKRLWLPFFDTLNKLRRFSLDQAGPLNLQQTKTEEFKLMNDTLKMTTNKARQDYLVLKDFTENASHEMQTPLAIIQSKLDLLIQDEQLTEKQSLVAQSVYESIQKLSRLNQSLLLLAKIGNNQFAERTTINLKEKLEKKMEAFQELWLNEDITVTSSLENMQVNINSVLMDILLNNLLSNATKHNFQEGNIHLIINEKGFMISNTSKDAGLDQTRLYNKFYTEQKKAGNNGLGLSIIKLICDTSALTIAYSFLDSRHSFTISPRVPA